PKPSCRPPSPTPGRGLAGFRAAVARRRSRGGLLRRRDLADRLLGGTLRPGGRSGVEALIKVEQDLLLLLGQRGVAPDGRADVDGVGPLLEDARLHVERLGGDAKRFRDRLEDLGARTAQAALDLREVRVGNAGE